MAKLPDFYYSWKPVSLYDATSISADTYSKYVDTLGYNGVAFLVGSVMTTADASNYITPKVYGYTGDTPGTGTNYTVCASTELNGAFTSRNSQTTHEVEVVSLKHKAYRYYHVWFDETLTAEGIVWAVALLFGETQSVYDDSPTTGTVS